MLRFLLLITAFGLLPHQGITQSARQLKKQAAAYFKVQNYVQTNALLEQLREKRGRLSKEQNYQFAVCQTYLHHFDQAQAIFNILKYKKQKAAIAYWKARIAHLQEQYDVASNYYKIYLQQADDEDILRKTAKLYLHQCAYGVALGYGEQRALVSSISEEINSPHQEWNAQTNPRQSKQLFFTSNRPNINLPIPNFSQQICAASFNGTDWTLDEPLSSRYNTDKDEVLEGFMDFGYRLVYSRQGQTLVDNWDNDLLSLALPFAPQIQQPSAWTGNYNFFNDKIIIFSSDRKGGQGGKDLYWSVQLDSGKWLLPQNLGSTLNTPYDEVSPCLAHDGRTLYFSSNNPKSLGGFDVFKSTFNDSLRQWSLPEHLAAPISSSGDDVHFVLLGDGLQAMFSSDRASGKGGLDIYTAYFRKYLPEQEKFSNPACFTDVFLKYMLDITSQIVVNPVDTQQTISNPTIQNVHITPIFYTQVVGDQPSTQRNVQTMQRVWSEHPKLHLVITAHSDNSGLAAQDLFLSLKQAQTLAQLFIKQGVAASQIHLRGCGQQYPIAQNENINQQPNEAGKQLNRRLEVQFYNETEALNLRTDPIIVSDILRHPDSKRYNTKNEGLSYKVEVAQTSVLWQHPILDKFTDICTEQDASEAKIHYLIGWENSFKAIVPVYEKLQAAGFAQARVVPYINGIALSTDDAVSLEIAYPDLLEFNGWEGNK